MLAIFDAWSSISEAVPMAPVAAVGVIGAAKPQAYRTELQESTFGSIERVALIMAIFFLCLASYSHLRGSCRRESESESERRQEPVEKATRNVKTGKQGKNAKKGSRRS